MSEFTENYRKRVEKLTAFAQGLLNGEKGNKLLDELGILEPVFQAKDTLLLFDNLFETEKDIEKIKVVSNKLFNILFKNLTDHPEYSYPKDSILSVLLEDNQGLKALLNDTKVYIKQINKTPEASHYQYLITKIEQLQAFMEHYSVKENIIFPEIEKKWANYQCVKLMWSFHDDIRRNIKKVLEILQADVFDLKLFNQVSSKMYFNIHTILFREEHVLFPIMSETFETELLDKMTEQLDEFTLLFVKSQKKSSKTKQSNTQTIQFSTGEVSIEQAELIFNHLPVDITFVDENDTVKFFSTPKHRIFPRTTSIIGRAVQNCHPHESVEIVNKIVASFKNGEKDVASFWLHMGPKFVLIQYFAVRDENKAYRGVLEVSQEISEIQKLEGERKLLDW